MRVLLIGVGGVGEAIALIAEHRDPDSQWLEQMVLADYDLSRALEVQQKLIEGTRFPAEQVDAGDPESVRLDDDLPCLARIIAGPGWRHKTTLWVSLSVPYHTP